MQPLLKIYCLQDDALQSTLIGEEILPDIKTNDRPEWEQQQNEFLIGIRNKLLDKLSKETYQ